MDGEGNMNFRNWGFVEASGNTIKNHLGLQLMSSINEKPLFGGGGVHDVQHVPHPLPVMASTNGGPFHHHRVGGISESYFPVDYWMNREKYLSVLSGNHNHGFFESNSLQMTQQINSPRNESAISGMEACEGRDNGCSGSNHKVLKKRGSGKVAMSPPKEKKQRTRTPKAPKDESTPPLHSSKAPKKPAEVVINGVCMDMSELPVPVCSCTGTPHQCYRWGSGGWQSACCTTSLSIYPLPMSTKRRGARIAGRKMSIGAFKKVLEKLASEGYGFSSPIDLRSYWAKHGTNKFVTIR